MPPRTPPVVPASNRGALSAPPSQGGGGGSARGNGSSTPGGNNGSSTAMKRKDTCLEQIQLLQKKREQRRRSMEEKRAERAAEEKRLTDQGMPGDVDFQRMIRDFQNEHGVEPHPHIPPGDLKICICVRKRPINEKEKKRKDYDAVTCFNPVVMVHDCKLRVDGITKYLDNTDFAFDHTFAEDDTTDQLYYYTAAPLIPFIFQGGRATCFAYGQTGSGKTYTMAGIQQQAAKDIFDCLEKRGEALSPNLAIYVSFFEIYGGRCQDLLNERHRLIVREDGKGDVVISELEEMEAQNVDELLGHIEEGNRNRTTHATEVNDVSSRSHAICQIVLRSVDTGKMYGKLSLVDLAGSERGADTKSHNHQRRMESAEINKSLLALKECIRALDSDSVHVPYRASKLTLVLKDCFAKEKARTVMIATVSPNASSADHTLNTLRYADRVKEKNVDHSYNAADGGKGGKGGRRGGSDANRGLDGEFSIEDEELPLEDEEEEEMLDESGGVMMMEEDDEEEGDWATTNEVVIEGSRDRSPSPPIAVIPPPRKGGAGGGIKQQQPHTQVEEKSSAPPPSSSTYKQKGGGLPPSKPSRDRGGSSSSKHNMHNNNSGEVDTVELHRAVQSVWEDEEALLNLHMNVIQENAELLTEEGRLLQQVQEGGDVVEYDLDAYTVRLEEILDRKMQLIADLRHKLDDFRKRLQREEREKRRI